MAKIPLSQITNVAGALGVILVTPNENIGYQPQPASGQSQDPSLMFNYEGEQTVTLDSDITDHFVEDNTAIQDQISLKPITVTTSGYIGELNDVVPSALQSLRVVSEKLTVVGGYAPGLSTTALIAYAQAKQLYDIAASTLNSAVSAWNTITGGNSQTKQQAAYSQFEGYWKRRTLFTIQTPWTKYEDMAIKTLRAIQDEETRMISTFEITFKQIKFAKTVTRTKFSSFQGRAKNQSDKVVNLGVQSLGEFPVGFSPTFRS